MKKSEENHLIIQSDLGLDKPFIKGQKQIPVRNCWHFSTDGNAVDEMFYDEEDFIAGMNRIYVVVQGYRIVILAFSLMDTHVHFVLYGQLDECKRFMHDYIRRTSRHIAVRHGDRHKLEAVPIHYQTIDTDRYLKTVICYTVKNAPVAGIPYNAWDYPWSSGPLYFRRPSIWSSPAWLSEDTSDNLLDKRYEYQRKLLKVRDRLAQPVKMMGSIIFPGEYVDYQIVEQLFKTCRSYNYFLCTSRDDDVEANGGAIARLSIPMQEMRQHKNDLCREMFGVLTVKKLTTAQRIKLARRLRSQYNSSIKQIVRLCCLVYDEVKDVI